MSVRITTPELMAPLLANKQVENIFFKKHLRQFASAVIDEKVHRFYPQVSADIDCLACANCCKKLEPGLEHSEVERLAEAAKQSIEVFKQQFLAYDGDALYLQTKPCMFLNGCACTIYEQRPAACGAYPHLDQPDMKFRQTFWANYSICPIVFNVVEQLKQETGFNYGNGEM